MARQGGYYKPIETRVQSIYYIILTAGNDLNPCLYANTTKHDNTN